MEPNDTITTQRALWYSLELQAGVDWEKKIAADDDPPGGAEQVGVWGRRKTISWVQGQNP